MGPVPAVAPQPSAGAARAAPCAEPRDGCVCPAAAAPALRWPDAALCALLGKDRHAALLLSLAWVAAYGFAAGVSNAAACPSPRLTPGRDPPQGTQAPAQSLLYVATSEVALRFSVRRTAVVLTAAFSSSQSARQSRSAPRQARSKAALTRRAHHPPRSWSSPCSCTSGLMASWLQPLESPSRASCPARGSP